MVVQLSKILVSTYNSVVSVITQVLGTGVQANISVTGTSGVSPYPITCNSTSSLLSGQIIYFSASLGGLTTNTRYYVNSVLSSTTFNVTTTLGGSAQVLTTATGSITASTGSIGYGQSLNVGSVINTGTKVTQAQWAAVFTDLTRIATHQGTTISITAPTAGGKITSSSITAFETAATTISSPANLYALGAGQFSDTTMVTSSRSTNWNVEINHNFTVDFGSAANARYFFNTGGSIRLSASKTDPTTPNTNDTDWRVNILGAMGTIVFNFNGAAGSSGTNSSIGFFDLKNTPQQIFLKSGSTYTSNFYRIDAYCDVSSNTTGSARYLYFQIRFVDAKTGNPNIDEPVGGQITSTVIARTASGTNFSVTSPTASNTTLLTVGS